MRRSARAGTGEKRPREAGDEPAAPPEAKKRQAPPSAEPRRHTKPPAKPAAKKPVPRTGSQTAKPASRPALKSTPRTASQPAAKPAAAKRARPGVEALQESAAAKRAAMLEKERTKADALKAKETAKAVKEAAAEEKRRRAADLKADRERKTADKETERAEKAKRVAEAKEAEEAQNFIRQIPPSDLEGTTSEEAWLAVLQDHARELTASIDAVEGTAEGLLPFTETVASEGLQVLARTMRECYSRAWAKATNAHDQPLMAFIGETAGNLSATLWPLFLSLHHTEEEPPPPARQRKLAKVWWPLLKSVERTYHNLNNEALDPGALLEQKTITAGEECVLLNMAGAIVTKELRECARTAKGKELLPLLEPLATASEGRAPSTRLAQLYIKMRDQHGKLRLVHAGLAEWFQSAERLVAPLISPQGILRELSGFLEVAHQRLMTDASLESEWRTLLGQTAGLTPDKPDPGAELKRRLLERFFHSRAKRSCAHAMDTARKFKKADTAVRAQAKTRKSSSGSAGGGVVVKFNKSALQRTMTPSQLHKTLVALVSLAGHLLVLEKSTKVDEAKALVKAYGGLVGGAAAPKTKSGWLDALVACIHAQQSEGFSQPDNDIMLADL